jgi:hypothetical protein
MALETRRVGVRARWYRKSNALPRWFMTGRAVDTGVAGMIEPHRKILQTGKAFHRTGLGICVADSTDRRTAARRKLLLMTADAGRVTRFTGEANAGWVVIATVTEQARHARMRRVGMEKSREIHRLRIGHCVARGFGYGCERIALKSDRQCVAETAAGPDQYRERDQMARFALRATICFGHAIHLFCRRQRLQMWSRYRHFAKRDMALNALKCGIGLAFVDLIV